MKKIVASVFVAVIAVLALPAAAFAHVVVTPDQTDVGEQTLFTVSVPNEKNVAMSSIKLDIPKGLQDVQPNVTAGWDITTTTDTNDDITSITWTGVVPAGERADLVFKAQAPATAGQLDWKAYQTYIDGTVVHWDQKPSSNNTVDDSSDAGPYSVTNVVNDLNANSSTTGTGNNTTLSSLALAFSIVALVASLSSLLLRRHRS